LAKSRAATTLANLLACPRFGRAWMGTIHMVKAAANKRRGGLLGDGLACGYTPLGNLSGRVIGSCLRPMQRLR
jgi:hypothetical protein